MSSKPFFLQAQILKVVANMKDKQMSHLENVRFPLR
jgi:hypothetical protein